MPVIITIAIIPHIALKALRAVQRRRFESARKVNGAAKDITTTSDPSRIPYFVGVEARRPHIGLKIAAAFKGRLIGS